MGTNIVNFPIKSVRDWLMIEREMKEIFLKGGVSSSVQARLIEKMKSFYELLDVEFNSSIDIVFPSILSREQTMAICSDISQKIGAASSEQLKAFTNKLFIDRLYREIDMCRELGLFV